MTNDKKIEWALRIGVAGEFIGHGVLAVQGKADWVSWMQQITHVNHGTAVTLILIIGLFDLVLAISVLVKPVRPLLLWMAVWGFWTALLRPIVGQSIWDFVERSANWGAPLALYFLTTISEKINKGEVPVVREGYLDSLIKKVK